ncbi:hypothetical protein REPUB_Repub01dG0149000 [Reevesia pubescens]
MSKVESLGLEWCPFWVQVHGLPIGMQTEKIGFLIGDNLGDVIEVEAMDSHRSRGKFLQVRAMINITKPLQRGVCLTIRDGVRIVVMFKYEHLPDICFVCGCLDHHESDCATAFCMRRSGEAVRRDYGPWLSADFR